VLPEIYIPYTLADVADRTYMLCHGRPEALEKAVSAQVYAADPDSP
jgi:hypothetical protein